MPKKTGKRIEKKTSMVDEIASSVERISKEYSKLWEAWDNFYEAMENKIAQNIGSQQDTYERFYQKWTDFSRELGSRIGKYASDQKWREIYDVWRNYVNKMTQRMSKTINDGVNHYTVLNKSFQDSAKYVNDQLSSMAYGKYDQWEPKKLYEAWHGLSSNVKTQINHFAKHANAEWNDLSSTWTDFSETMWKLLDESRNDGETFKELASLWTESSRAIGKSLTDLVTQNNGDLDSLEKAWENYRTTVEKEILRATKRVGVDYEELWKWYFESQEPWFKGFGTSIWGENQNLKKEVKDLRKRVEDLEKRTKK